jgi:hypothetical protein
MGADLRGVAPGTLNVQPLDGALIFDRAGPSPGSVSLLRSNASVVFQWTGRLSPGGTMGFTTSVSATGPHGIVGSGLVDCGVTGSDAAAFDPASFAGTCVIEPGSDGTITLDLRNTSSETFEHIEAIHLRTVPNGTVTVLDLLGPAPRNARTLPSGARREFTWSARFLGSGTITMEFQGRATRATQERITTETIRCEADVGMSEEELPDLGVDQLDLSNSLMLESRQFSSDDCAVFEGCVGGSGVRRLLRFNTTTPNYGPGDIFLGDPRNSPSFEYSACHNHYHFREYADYRLLDGSGRVVARGHKQAFCLVDLWRPPGLRGDPNPQFTHCGFQGISAGWADLYHRGLDCQWIDVTGVPSGRYVIEVTVNPAGVIREHNYANNVARAEVTLP